MYAACVHTPMTAGKKGKKKKYVFKSSEAI